MPSKPSRSLDDLLTELVDEMPDVKLLDGREYSRDGVVFATRPESHAMELRLGPEIADAAMRTPDTRPSSRGPDWIAFAPKQWEQHAIDRLDAWYRLAWRNAGKTAR